MSVENANDPHFSYLILSKYILITLSYAKEDCLPIIKKRKKDIKAI